jgi:S1-C subfamily serine protease
MVRGKKAWFFGLVLALAVAELSCKKAVESKDVVVVAAKSGWKKVQDAAQYGVVQILSYQAEPDFLKPYYKESGEGRGSGALVEDAQGKGLILTSYHVIENAIKVGIQMPLYCGKRMIPAEVVGVCPDYDIALLQLDPRICAELQKQFGTLPALKLGDSDKVHRSEQLLGLSFPLGEESLKSMTGVVSGYEHVVSQSRLRFHPSYAIQVSTPLNPGSSGGPVLNKKGEIVGICMSAADAQSVGFIVPVNYYKMLAPQLKQGGLTRKPFFGALFCRAKDNELAELLGNPLPAGCYLSYVSATGLAGVAGIKEGDMIYAINGFAVDPYGCIAIAGRTGDRLFVQDYLASFPIGSELFVETYRRGVKHDYKVVLNLSKQPAIRWKYSPYDVIDYEIVGGLLIQELSLNIIALFEHTQMGNQLPNVRARLVGYKEDSMREESVLVVTHVFPSSAAYYARSCGIGAVITHVDDTAVKTLEEVRTVLQDRGKKQFISFKMDDNELLALPVKTIIEDEVRLAQSFGYQMTSVMKQLMSDKK